MANGRKSNSPFEYRNSGFNLCIFCYSIPAVEVTLGDVLVMNVHNSLNEPTALHAHGQFQNGTNWMDGPVMVTQW